MTFGPMGAMRKPGVPAPFVFGPSGVFNPAVVMGPMAILAFMGGGMPQLLGAFGFIVALGMLARFGWKKVRPATILLAVAVTVVAVTLMALAYTVNPDPSPPLVPASVADAPRTLPAGAIPLADHEVIEDITPYLLQELRSSSILLAPSSVPAVVPGVSSAGVAMDVRSLDSPPRLESPGEAAVAAARAYRGHGRPPVDEASAVVWVRVEAQGGVSERRVISSSSAVATSAALDASRHFRYIPATKDGVPLPVWVVQPIVFVP
jgi:TonB family protein